ncbi:MAG: HindIII family type II restriction endonuclease [Candidatus Gastranaerophilales bacterium]|nr:HindIII family type II restriction endonuclease [Candidatus Gastranaerophilales bacterium]
MFNFIKLKNLIKTESGKSNFVKAVKKIEKIIFSLEKNDLVSIVTKIGIIPEDIEQNSTEEKLYAKTADLILAKCFQELGLKSAVINQRANCADVFAKSLYHKYSLVADAKTFRLNRTAKNQKDFKVKSMVDWKEDNDYAILACPYFQYPKSNSQIFGQALSGNVLLSSWEYFSILLKNNIRAYGKSPILIKIETFPYATLEV